MKVLLVEENSALRRVIRQLVALPGIWIQECADAANAMAAHAASPADLVIMDILMPDQDGLETTATLLREFPNVKVIAITGGSDMIGILNFLDVAKMLGSHSILLKPFEMKTLLDPIQAELQAYRVLKKSLFSPVRPRHYFTLPP